MCKINELPTPCFVIDEGKLEENLRILHQVEERTGAKIPLAVVPLMYLPISGYSEKQEKHF